MRRARAAAAGEGRRTLSILAVDTATEACSAAVLSAPAHLVSRYEEPGRGHAERILALIDAVLAESQLTLGELDAIAFGRGPGAFTGVRLAASIAQGLAFAQGLPVVPVSNLRALAQRALDAAPEARGILVCADARMREVYWGCFRRGAQGLAEPVPAEPVPAEPVPAEPVRAEPVPGAPPPSATDSSSGERLSAPDAVDLPASLEEPVHGVGRGFVAYPQLEARLAGRLGAIHGSLLPRAEEIARLAASDFAAGLTVEAQGAIPTYLRDEVARPPARGLASRD